MEQKPVFKVSTFGGFEKHSVLNYIEEITAKSAEMEKSLNAKLEEFSSANSQLSTQVAEFEKKMVLLETQLKNEQDKIGQLTGEIDKLNLDILSQKKTEHELTKELRIKEEQHIILTEKLHEAESKADKYDEAAIDIGALFIDAQQSAQKIVANAMQDAEYIKHTTYKNVETISDKLNTFRTDIDGLRTTISVVVDSIAVRLDEIVASVDEMEEKCRSIAKTFHGSETKTETVTTDMQQQ